MQGTIIAGLNDYIA